MAFYIYIYNCLYYYLDIDFDIFDIKNKEDQFYLGCYKSYELIKLLDDFTLDDSIIESHELTKIVWTVWWQDEVPDFIQYIIDKRVLPYEYKQIIINNRNYKEYIDIPDRILELVNSKKISLTHFSDYIRISLLNKYGGIWMDATLLITKQLDKEIFETLKDNAFYTLYGLNWTKQYPILANTWFFMSNKNSKIMRKIYNLFNIYYDCFDIMIDYCAFDFFFVLIFEKYNKYTQLKPIINSCSFNKTTEYLRDINIKELPINEYGIYKLTYKNVKRNVIEVVDELIKNDFL